MIVLYTMSTMRSCSCACGRFHPALSRRWTTRKNIGFTSINAYFTNTSYQYYTEQFRLKFPDAPVPGKVTFYDLVRRVRESGSVKDEQKAAALQLWLLLSWKPLQLTSTAISKKSLRRLCQQLFSTFLSWKRAIKRCHTPKENLESLHEFFVERIISRGIWPHGRQT